MVPLSPLAIWRCAGGRAVGIHFTVGAATRALIRRWKEAMSTPQNPGYECAFKALAEIVKIYRSIFKN